MLRNGKGKGNAGCTYGMGKSPENCVIIPQADKTVDRVDYAIDFLLRQHSSAGRNALMSFVQVLAERVDPRDAYHSRLVELAAELTLAYKGDMSEQSGSNVEEPFGFEEIVSLKRQIAKLKRNLLTIEESKAEFVDPRSIPPDLAESERLTLERITEMEAGLAELRSQSDCYVH